MLGKPTGRVIPCHATTLSREFNKAFIRAGIQKDIRPSHGLRHYGATKLIEAGVSIKLVSEILGHTQVSTTERYTHPDVDSLRDGIEYL